MAVGVDVESVAGFPASTVSAACTFTEGADARIDVSIIFTIRTECGGSFSDSEA